MALLERVATLLRANLNDMIDRAEEPVKMMNQVVLDMENQLLQVKTQVAIAVADHHLLEKKRDENAAREADWIRKAELSLAKQDEELARVALQRSIACRDMAKALAEQMADQKVQVENLKGALGKLDAKLAEARMEAQLLAARHRRARTANRLAELHPESPDGLERAREKVDRDLALGRAKTEMMAGDGVEERFVQLEKHAEIERMLEDLKSRSAKA